MVEDEWWRMNRTGKINAKKTEPQLNLIKRKDRVP